MVSILLSAMVALPAENTCILSALNPPEVPLAIMHLASHIHQGQALWVTRAERAGARLTQRISDP